MNAATHIVECLKAWRLRSCASLADLLALDASGNGTNPRAQTIAGFVERPGMQVEEHLDIDPAVLVYDAHLGTLGIVEVLDTTNPDAISDLIEKAAYLRQLCLLQAERTSTAGQPDSRALTVELVLVFPATASGDGVTAASLKLRDFVRDTGYLRSIGVSLLHERPEGGFAERDLRRAFAWLVIDVRHWFASRAAANVSPAGGQEVKEEPPAPPWSVTLTNYRHHGVRKYVFDGRAAFHVLHGYNGAGKSTLSEAFELLLTESIERLEQANQKKYFPVVRFRRRQLPGSEPAAGEDETSPAIITVRDGETDVASVEVFDTTSTAEHSSDRRRRWLTQAPEWRGVAGSFRLDQRLMDMLVHSPEGKRAELFLRAYFPTEATKFAQRDRAAVTADEAIALVPSAIRSRVPTGVDNPRTTLRNELAWTGQMPAKWSGGMLPTLEACLPVSAAQLRLLGRVNDTVATVVKRFDSEGAAIRKVATELTALDAALAAIPAVGDIVRDLQCALDIFDEFESWQPVRATGTRQSFQQALDEWLDLQALADLASKHYDVAATVTAARKANWHAVGDEARLLDGVAPPETQVAALRTARDRLIEERAKARNRVDELSNRRAAATGATARAYAQPTRSFLKPNEIEALNRSGGWLPSLHATTTEPFGVVFERALKDNSRSGLPSTFASARAEATDLRGALAALQASAPASAAAFSACRAAFKRLKRLARVDAAIQDSFFMQLTRGEHSGPLLNNALNELLALFKPAPWAYADISLKAGGASSQSQELRIATADDGRADLRLNTAEMNAFALSLCLLCAPTLNNPLRLVLLDDPLQNMDEMTVAAVARGLGRLIRVYPPGWRVVALFHSEEDLRRLQEEVPTATYRLPWVTATPIGGEPPIEAERSFDTVPRLQLLRELLYVGEIPTAVEPA